MTDKGIYGFYEELYNKVKAQNEKEKVKPLTICPAIKGEEYKEGGLMFVGRAINGWCPLSESIRVEEGIEDRIKRCEKCTLDWVVGKNTWSHCIESNCPYAKAQGDPIDGRGKNSPFWQMVKFICKEEGITEDWYKKIVWTNLYKASYENGGNPSGFYGEQIEICNKILIEEIEIYSPQKIYFITETNRKKLYPSNRTWFCESYPDGITHFQRVYESLREKNIEVYVLTRPEYQNKENVFNNKEKL